MRRTYFYWVLCITLMISLGLITPVHGQTLEAKISVLDGDNQPITSLIDGNLTTLNIELAHSVNVNSQVDFLLSGLDAPVASCTVKSGQRDCRSASFPALGWYWDNEGKAYPQRDLYARINGQQLPASLRLEITPRPVVMVHGFNADFHTWDNYLGPQGYLAALGLHGFAVGDGQVEGVLNTGSLSNPAARTNTIAENAVILGRYIKNVQRATGAEKVDLLVHSMGGMISRYYLDRVMTEVNVTQLIILGTPMAGSACANLPAALGLLLPATLEIQPSYMSAVFNQQIVHRRGVPFYALAGTKLLDSVQSPCTPVPSDLVVTVDSVKAIPMPVEEIPLYHMDLNTSEKVFNEFVTLRLKTPPGKFEVAVDPPVGSIAQVEEQFTRIYTGHLAPGETESVTISIDPNVTVAGFAMYDTSRSLDVRVTGASGNEITLDPVANGLIRVEDPSIMVYLGYGFKSPKPGKWVVTLLTTGLTPAEGAYYALSARFEGGATLTTTSNLTTPRLNQPVEIATELTSDGLPVSLDSAQAVLHHPGAAAEILAMSVESNKAVLEIVPNEVGIYGVEIIANATTSEGIAVDRGTFLTFEVQPTDQRILQTRLILAVALVLFITVIILILRARKLKRTTAT
ncbi:MAG: hypothetical protein JW963_20595 [Anaerolineales bacterium]|nr:hypothetical protein [Anaerolineales bacterium]